MGEFPTEANIADSIDPRVGGLEAIVYQDAFARIILDADSLKIKPLDVWRAAGSCQNFIYGDGLFLSLCFITNQFMSAVALYSDDLRIQAHHHSLTEEGLLHQRGCLHVFTVEQVFIFVEQADLGTEPLESLCQFATDRSAANHREPGRTLGKAEHSFIGQVARLSQSRDGRLRGPRAGCDDRTLEAQRLARDLNRVGACKFGLAQEHIHSQL